MQLNLTEDEAHALHSVLHDYLPSLRLEVARTDAREIRHELLKRQDVCERVLELLEQAGV
jgi:hypothetical protein